MLLSLTLSSVVKKPPYHFLSFLSLRHTSVLRNVLIIVTWKKIMRWKLGCVETPASSLALYTGILGSKVCASLVCIISMLRLTEKKKLFLLNWGISKRLSWENGTKFIGSSWIWRPEIWGIIYKSWVSCNKYSKWFERIMRIKCGKTCEILHVGSGTWETLNKG